MSTAIRVGMSEVKTAFPPDVLVALGLGSCIGLCMVDPVIGVGGMAHVMLPDSKQSREVTMLGKFADTAVPYLLQEMEKLGASRKRLLIKLVGGAQMFAIGGQDDRLSIGQRNVDAVRQALRSLHLYPNAESVGGNQGKTVILDPANGQVMIRTINASVVYL